MFKKKQARLRIGSVSCYEHHGSWYIYYREAGKQVRVRVGNSDAVAQCTASLINARLIAAGSTSGAAAGSAIDLMALAADLLGIKVRGGQAAEADVVGPGIDVGELRRHFLDHHEHVAHSALSTVSRYAAATQHLVDYCRSVSNSDAIAIDAAAFTAYLRRIQVSPNGHSRTIKRRLMDKGIRFILETCRAMFRFGQRFGHLPKALDNPFSELGLKQIRVRTARPHFVFTAEQAQDFLRTASLWSFAIHFTLATTGMRPGELAHMLVDDVDLTGGWIAIRNKPEMGWMIKTGRERRVPIAPELAVVLRHLIAGRSGGPVFLRPKADPDKAWLMTATAARMRIEVQRRLDAAVVDGGRELTRREERKIRATIWRDAGAIDTDAIRVSVIRTAKAAGIEATCPKSWRHTFATLLQEAGVDLLIRQEVLGHKPLAAEKSALGMTSVYTHASPLLVQREIDRALRLWPQVLGLVTTKLGKEVQG